MRFLPSSYIHPAIGLRLGKKNLKENKKGTAKGQKKKIKERKKKKGSFWTVCFGQMYSKRSSGTSKSVYKQNYEKKEHRGVQRIQ